MSPLVLACVMAAAFLHAGWNAVLRGGRDRLWSMTLMMIAVACVSAATMVFLPGPNAASWPYVISPALIHTADNLSLVWTYRSGDPGQTYPIARLLARPRGAGRGLVRAGSPRRPAVRWRRAGLWRYPLARPPGAAGARRLPSRRAAHRPSDRGLHRGRRDRRSAVREQPVVRGEHVPAVEPDHAAPLLRIARRAAGLHGPANLDGARRRPRLDRGLRHRHLGHAVRCDGVVSALRETSVVYAAPIGRLCLGEELSVRRFASSLAVAIGAACLAW